MVRQLVTSSITSRDCESQSLKSSDLETRTRINYPRGPFMHTLEHRVEKSPHSA